MTLPGTTKPCGSCLADLPLGDYYRDKRRPDGLYRQCKKCHGKVEKKYYEANKAAAAARAKEWRAQNPEKVKEIAKRASAKAYATNGEALRARSARYRAENPEKARAAVRAAIAKIDPDERAAYHAQYYAENRETIKERISARAKRLRVELRPYNSARVMKRIARKLQATPSWANQDAMLELYQAAAAATKATGVAHHVDHVVPLQGKTVCGLHVENNLEVLPGSDNQSKSNRWWPDDWRDVIPPAATPPSPTP